MKVVVDTNVLVSGLISPGNAPGTIVNMIAEAKLRVCFDARILAEYRSVLKRPEFKIPANRIAEILAQIGAAGEGGSGCPLQFRLPDPSDEAFLEVAVAVRPDCLITGNLKHFPAVCRQGIAVFSPAEFLEFYREWQSGAGDSGKVKSVSEKYRVKTKRSSSRSKGRVAVRKR